MAYRTGGIAWALRMLGICMLSLLAATPARALDRNRTLAQFHHTAWTLHDGAPADVHALAQTADGYLWIGSSNGLYRFDGVRFERFETRAGDALPSGNISALLALPTGELWVGFRFGGASLLRNERVVAGTPDELVKKGSLLGFAQDLDGNVWAAAADALARFDGEHWQLIGADWGFPDDSASGVWVDRAGTLWVSGRNSLMVLERGARTFHPGNGRGQGAHFAEAADGRIWLSQREYGLLAASRTADPGEAAWLWPKGSGPLAVDRDDSLWVGRFEGIERIAFPERLGPHSGLPADLQRFTQKDGLSGDVIGAVLEDREGNIWIGSNGGLDRFRRNKLRV